MPHPTEAAASVTGSDEKGIPPANIRPPLVPPHARQQNAAAAQKIAALELQLKYSEDR
ncbi:hypothetical protein FRC07_013254, partial [Ceratobasidium sp. 392]